MAMKHNKSAKKKALVVYFKTKTQMETIRRAAKQKELSLSRFLVDAGMREAEAQLQKRSA